MKFVLVLISAAVLILGENPVFGADSGSVEVEVTNKTEVIKTHHSSDSDAANDDDEKQGEHSGIGGDHSSNDNHEGTEVTQEELVSETHPGTGSDHNNNKDSSSSSSGSSSGENHGLPGHLGHERGHKCGQKHFEDKNGKSDNEDGHKKSWFPF